MKKSTIIAVLLATLAVFSIAEATAMPCKVGVVNINQVLSDSSQAKAIQSKLDQQYKPQVEALQKAMQGDEAKLKKDGVTMQASQKQALQQDIQKSYASLNKLQAQYQQQFHKQIEPLMSDLQTTVNLVAKKHHYCVIIPKAVTVYATDSVDLTTMVNAAFNKHQTNHKAKKVAAGTNTTSSDDVSTNGNNSSSK